MTQRRRLDHYLVEQAVAAGAEFRDGVKVADVRADEHGAGVTVDGAPVEAPVARRRRRRQRHDAQGARARRRLRARRGVRGQRLRRSSSATASTAWPSSSWGRSRAATAGSSRRATTSTSASAAGRATGRRCAAISASSAARTGSPRTRSRTCAATGCRCGAPGRSPARGRALLVGDAAGLVDPLSGDGMYEAFASVAARHRVDRATCSKAGPTSLESYNAEALGRARAQRRGVVGGEDRARPLPVAHVHARPAPARLGRRRADAERRPQASGRRERPGPVALKLIERIARSAGDPGAGYRAEAHAA